MPKFIKFIYNEGLIIVNTDEIQYIDCDKKTKIIKLLFKNSISIEYEEDSIETFKDMSDAIMEQLEI